MASRPVGRPPELDSEGRPITKCLVNDTIPVKLRDFLARNKINRSQLFTQVVTKMYQNKICPKCYGDNIEETPTSFFCNDCTDHNKYFYLSFKECVNPDCDEYYNLINNHPDYNCFQTEFDGAKLIKKGCSKCIISEK